MDNDERTNWARENALIDALRNHTDQLEAKFEEKMDWVKINANIREKELRRELAVHRYRANAYRSEWACLSLALDLACDQGGDAAINKRLRWGFINEALRRLEEEENTGDNENANGQG